jgi:hypothetical protein
VHHEFARPEPRLSVNPQWKQGEFEGVEEDKAMNSFQVFFDAGRKTHLASRKSLS